MEELTRIRGLDALKRKSIGNLSGRIGLNIPRVAFLGALAHQSAGLPINEDKVRWIDYLEGGETIDDFLDGFPTVTREQVVAFLEEAKARMVASAS